MQRHVPGAPLPARDVTILGGGMAGLCAAARAHELGARPVVYEKGARPGGSMLLSSGVVWRHREWEDFRNECPCGDPELQRAVFERLEEGVRWLESLGAPVLARETGNPLTTGVRFEPSGLTEALARAAGEVRVGETPDALQEPVVLATGGFQGDATLVDEHIRPAAPLALRANRWSTGDGLRAGLERGAALTAAMDEFYGRNMPDAPFAERDFVPAAQLYARHALVLGERGDEFLAGAASWSETDVVQQTARQPGAAAWYVLTEEGLHARVRERTVADMVETARSLGGTVVAATELPFDVPTDAVLAVRVRAAITHTIGGLSIDTKARVLAQNGAPVDGLYACGADAGGISAGGYASGLAAALVFGRIAAETAVS